ncbi:hypothetical protein V6N13_048838 [Hibiscus sabdariffa]|uniref:Uncharacterized protein n=1 Tax=Hibiscus sabdariffa TaxID=183260 RepID=A0ABR2DIE6_9ROSI
MANEFTNFPPNLDDGELWLPSDIFLNEAHSKFNPHLHLHLHNHNYNYTRPPFSCMDDLASRFAAHSLPMPHHKLPKPTNFQRFHEPVCYSAGIGTGSEAGHSFYGFRNGPFLGGAKPVHECQFSKQTQAQVESYFEARTKVLLRQRNRLFQNRDLPFQANGFNNYTLGLGGGLVRKAGGTGVFHPRILNTAVDSEKKQSLRNRQSEENQVIRGMNIMKRVGAAQREDCYYHLPPEMGFPRDCI